MNARTAGSSRFEHTIVQPFGDGGNPRSLIPVGYKWFDEPFELLVRLSFGHTRHLSYLGARQPALPIVLDLLPYRV
jgi:hypothetical protein